MKKFAVIFIVLFVLMSGVSYAATVDGLEVERVFEVQMGLYTAVNFSPDFKTLEIHYASTMSDVGLIKVVSMPMPEAWVPLIPKNPKWQNYYLKRFGRIYSGTELYFELIPDTKTVTNFNIVDRFAKFYNSLDEKGNPLEGRPDKPATIRIDRQITMNDDGSLSSTRLENGVLVKDWSKGPKDPWIRVN